MSISVCGIYEDLCSTQVELYIYICIEEINRKRGRERERERESILCVIEIHLQMSHYCCVWLSLAGV